VPRQFSHEALAKTHYFIIWFTFGIKISTFSTTIGNVVLFLKVCSNAKNFKILKFTEGWKQVLLYMVYSGIHLYAISSVYLSSSLSSIQATRK
jgi:hypothetical protein